MDILPYTTLILYQSGALVSTPTTHFIAPCLGPPSALSSSPSSQSPHLNLSTTSSYTPGMRPSLKVVMYFHPYPSQMRQTLSHPYSASPTRHSGYFLMSFRRNGAMRLNALISQSCFSLWSS